MGWVIGFRKPIRSTLANKSLICGVLLDEGESQKQIFVPASLRGAYLKWLLFILCITKSRMALHSQINVSIR
jgi:hypothetical protein